MDLFNAVVARFGDKSRIVWKYARQGIVEDGTNGKHFYFAFRGNKYADYLELSSTDRKTLEQFKSAFANDFREILTKEGFLE